MVAEKNYQKDLIADLPADVEKPHGVLSLLEAVKPRGQVPFCRRLTEAYIERGNEAYVSRPVGDMVESYIEAFGGRSCQVNSKPANIAFGKYRSEVVRKLMGGNALPNGKRMLEVLFVGALLVLLDEGTPDYEACKSTWDGLLKDIPPAV